MRFEKYRFVFPVDVSQVLKWVTRKYFGVGTMFCLQEFSHVMASSREGSWQDGCMTSRATCCLQMQPSVPKKSLGGADWVVYPKGLSRFRAKTSWPCSGNQIQSLQNLCSAKGSVAGGVFLFWETFWEVKERQTTFWRRVLGNMNPVCCSWNFWTKGDQSPPVLAR